jgi:hypothetical protein
MDFGQHVRPAAGWATMSFNDVLKALGTGLKPTHKLVLVVIASFANHKTGRCNPKVRTIAKAASMSARNVHRILLRWRKADISSSKEISKVKGGCPAATSSLGWHQIALVP